MRIGKTSAAIALLATAWLLLPLRFSPPETNQVVALCAIEVAFIAAAAAIIILANRIWVRAVAAGPLVLFAGLYPCFLALSMVGGGPLKGYEVVDSVILTSSRVVAYRTNGGATTDYGIRVSQEMPVLPGIIVARDLHNGNHEYRAALNVLNADLVSVSINGGKPIEYKLRRFVYF